MTEVLCVEAVLHDNTSQKHAFDMEVGFGNC